MVDLIKLNLEFYEVLNAFPILKERLNTLDFEITDVKEGESVLDYFKKHSYTDEEVDFMVKKLNCDINYYLKKGQFPQVDIKPISEVLTIEND